MNNTLIKQDFAKFFGKAMNYKDFWKMNNEWETRFEQDYKRYCKRYNKPKEKLPNSKEKLKGRFGISWDMTREELYEELLRWRKRKPEEGKS